MREVLEYLDNGDDDDSEGYELLNELMSDDEDIPVRPIEYIEEQLEKHRQKRNDMFENVKRMTVEELTTLKGHVKDEL